MGLSMQWHFQQQGWHSTSVPGTARAAKGGAGCGVQPSSLWLHGAVPAAQALVAGSSVWLFRGLAVPHLLLLRPVRLFHAPAALQPAVTLFSDLPTLQLFCSALLACSSYC